MHHHFKTAAAVSAMLLLAFAQGFAKENPLSLASSQSENGGKMKIILDGKTYSILPDTNITFSEISQKLPLELSMKNFGKHEFWAELPFKPECATERTSKILAGHVYYWDGWNAFVVNYIDWDIAPYRVVHLGEIEDKSICDILKDKSDGFKVRVEAGDTPYPAEVLKKNNTEM